MAVLAVRRGVRRRGSGAGRAAFPRLPRILPAVRLTHLPFGTPFPGSPTPNVPPRPPRFRRCPGRDPRVLRFVVPGPSLPRFPRLSLPGFPPTPPPRPPSSPGRIRRGPRRGGAPGGSPAAPVRQWCRVTARGSVTRSTTP
ncbi:hypothetical protein GCM10027168_48950 [Streptomyces capparidis]